MCNYTITKQSFLSEEKRMGWPENGKVIIKNLSEGNTNYPKQVNKVELLSTQQTLNFERNSEGLIVSFPEKEKIDSYANILKII